MAAKDVSSDWYAPNQQAVGQPGPARATSGGRGTTQRTTEAPDTQTDAYDPSGATVADVQAHVEAHPDQRSAVLKAEKAGKNRTTLVDWLASE